MREEEGRAPREDLRSKVDIDLRDANEKLELAELLTRLDKMELPESVDDRSAMQRLTDELKASRSVERLVKRRKAKSEYVHSPTCSGKCNRTCGKRHWKTKRKKRNQYYQNHTKYRRLELKGELLEAGSEGWWVYLTRLWKRHGVPIEMTYEEWNEHIWPTLKGRIPIIQRYQASGRGPIELGNVYVTESGNHKNVMFDGKEFLLKQQGYIL